MSPSAEFFSSASFFFFLCGDLCCSASAIIFWISRSVRPEDATMRMLCCFPVPRSLALTWTMPFASMSNATSIWGTPRGAGGMPTSSKRASVLLSVAISRSPCRTCTFTIGWLSTAVENTWDFRAGMVVFFSMIRVFTPPAVSTPSESGVTSSKRTSFTSPLSTPPWIAAPIATTSSGLTPLCGSLPKVQQVVQNFFGKEPHKGVNPDEVVAIGAAIQGGVLKGEVKDVLLLDVTPLSLGVETAGGVNTRIIEKNTTIPARKSQVFSTAVDNQPIVNVHVLQGEREMATDNKTLARFELVGIPPAPRGVPQIEVAFDIDANGIVHVSAKDLGTGKQQSIRIVASSGLTEREIQKMIADAEQHKSSAKKKKELADVKNSADGLIYTTEKALEEYATLLPAKDMAEIRADLEALKAVVGSEDLPRIKAAVQRLEGSAYRIADGLYSSGESGENETARKS